MNIKLKVLFAILAVLIISACANHPRGWNIAEGYQLTKDRNHNHLMGRVSIKYEDHEESKRKVFADSANRMSSQSVIDYEINKIPEGGYITVLIERSSIRSANTNNFQFITEVDGWQIYNQAGGNSIANVPGNTGMWWNIEVIPIDRSLVRELKLYVSDRITGGRDEFTIIKM